MRYYMIHYSTITTRLTSFYKQYKLVAHTYLCLLAEALRAEVVDLCRFEGGCSLNPSVNGVVAYDGG
jgi:hypothetical protein